MIFSKAIRIAAPLTGVAAALVLAARAAAAPTNPFGCRASVQATRPIAPLPAAEPYVANPAETPCATDSAGASQSSGGSAAAGSGSAGPGAAYTVSDSSTPGATALASVNGGTANGTGNSVVLTGPAQAQASYVCVNGSAVASGASDVTEAVVNGQIVRPASPGAETTTQMGGGSYTTINQQVQSATALTERAVFTHIEGAGDYVLGEARVTRPAGNPCTGGTGSGSGAAGSGSGGAGPGSGSGSGGGGSDSLNACPTGSVLVASAQMCEIVSGGSQSIDVSRPFAGPTGATVVSLAAARKKVKSACLSGNGPKYVVMGTNKANTIRAGTSAERILALGGNDTVIVKRGASCVDGGAGRDTISGGAGTVRLFGGAGNDTITAGPGNDWVWGNAGKDKITVGRGKDHVFGGAGSDSLRATGTLSYLNGGAGRDLAWVATKNMRYARRHGCEKVRRIRATH